MNSATGWPAHLQLDLQRRRQRTILAHCAHQGPLQVQRPFYPEGEAVCHIALLHPPGGVVGGDELRLEARLGPGAHALLTTPAAGKYYRSAGPMAHQIQRLTVAPGATLEWLPQENIVYNGARLQALTEIELQGDARLLGWEITCLGRPAAGERFTVGECGQTLEIRQNGEPLYLEKSRLRGGDALLDAAWGWQGQPVNGWLVCVPARPPGQGEGPLPPSPLVGEGRGGGAVDLLRAQWNSLAASDELVAATVMDGILIGRYLGPSTARAKRLFILAWRLLRPLMLHCPPGPSRFWTT